MRKTRAFLCFVLCLFLLLSGVPLSASADYAHTYTLNAQRKEGAAYPGVYVAQAVKGAKKDSATLGLPSIAKQNLENGPTTESPAVITGAALPYEKRTGPTVFEVIEGGALYEPYSHYRYSVIEEANPNGQGGTHRKMSGFDGTYVFLRVDVSALIAGASEDSYLHFRQEGNKALLVAIGMGYEGGVASDTNTAPLFTDSTGTRVGAFSLANNAAALKDTTGDDNATPYVDVILLSSGTLVQGADTGGQAAAGTPQADIGLSFYVDQTGDYNPTLVYDPQSTDANHEANVSKKFYDETRVSADDVTGYVVKGSDLELEVEVAPTEVGSTAPKEYWSLRKAMEYPNYNNRSIKLICEVPLLEAVSVTGESAAARNVVLDLNSFDFQMANHQQTGAAALTVKNATLTITDTSNTTGAELAVGNNASFVVESGGHLIVTQSCQLEVEYDAASLTPGADGQLPEAPDLTNGVLTVKNGGAITIQGVLTIEGAEGKPLDPAAPAARDARNAVLLIEEGGTLNNEGCLLIYGSLYNRGTINNSGKYADTIASTDPDKGTFTYHKGIQLSWKDDVTQGQTGMGALYNGADEDLNFYPTAQLVNTGDIVLVPGALYNYASLENQTGGVIYACAVNQVVIPITPTPEAPTITEKRLTLDAPLGSTLYNNGSWTNSGSMRVRDIPVVSNGRTGDIPAEEASAASVEVHFLENRGTFTNNGAYALGELLTYGTATRKAGSTLTGRVLVADGVFLDQGEEKLTQVYNAAKTEEADGAYGTYRWAARGAETLTVTPVRQTLSSGETPAWTVSAPAAAGAGVQYWVQTVQLNPYQELGGFAVAAGETRNVNGPVLPQGNRTIAYTFVPQGTAPAQEPTVSVTVVSGAVTPPAAIPDLVYNGQQQALVTTGGAVTGKLQYSLDGANYQDTVPTAKDAGDYTVSYKLEGSQEAAGQVQVRIAPKPLRISADDIASTAPNPELTVTISGLTEGDAAPAYECSEANGVITVSVNAGDYPNYAITCVSGKLAQRDDLTLTAKDTYGVYGKAATEGTQYSGYSISVTAPGATVYYSTTQQLTVDNYQNTTVATTTNPVIAAVGATPVYYYAIKGGAAVSGCRYVIIEKGAQAAPTGLTSRAPLWKNGGDGILFGLTPFTMEYRRADNNGAYTPVYMEDRLYVTAGTYLVRYKGDESHLPSPDAVVTVDEGLPITVSFDSNGGSAVADVNDMKVGDLIPAPQAPTRADCVFLGWAWQGREFRLDREVVTQPMTLTARWRQSVPFILDPDPETVFPFEDVREDAYYRPAVEWAYFHQPRIAAGVTETLFSPSGWCTRAQVVCFLWRAAGEPVVDGIHPFTDVKPGSYYEEAVCWAYVEGIVSGTGETTFSPDAVCTRREALTFLWRAQGKPLPTRTVSQFSDVPGDSYYTQAILWAEENGIAYGIGDGLFGAKRQCTRAQIVTFLFRCLGEA